MGSPYGNQHAAKAKRWQKAIERALSRYTEQNIDAGLDLAADRLVKLAIEDGARWAIEEIGNRIEGKAVQPIAGDDEHPPVQIKGVIDLVRPG
jgi:hypothetical protein